MQCLHSAVLLCYLLCSYLILRPPPRSTLFPYTTLFRSHRNSIHKSMYYALFPTSAFRLPNSIHSALRLPTSASAFMLAAVACATDSAISIGPVRSEEHTSELQSPSDLVCRLLLEKKKAALLNDGLLCSSLELVGHGRCLPALR